MQDFLDKVKKLWEQRAAVEKAKDALAVVSKAFEDAKRDVLKAMDVMELDKQHVPGLGVVYRQKSFSVKVPKGLDQKEALFKWIEEHKGKDVLDTLLSINSQTLNSFYKAELEAAKEAGDYNFALPGIDTPEVYYTIGMKKG